MEPVHVVLAEAGEYVDDAAEIWAQATAARDGDANAAPLNLSLPVIEDVVNSSPRSLLLVAVDGEDRAVGFALAEPVSGARDTDAELRYLGVHPGAWGRGVAVQLLVALRDQLKVAGFPSARLAVYVDNTRAAALYERLGWVRRGHPVPHPTSGRLEQQYLLNLQLYSSGDQCLRVDQRPG